MAMIQCPNGHLYDNAKNVTCPFCGGGATTVPLFDTPGEVGGGLFPPTEYPSGDSFSGGFTPPEPSVPGPGIPTPVPPTQPVDTAVGKTTYVEKVTNKEGIVEVRGWLVCLEGAKKGVDFKIHAEKNFIGRGSDNDIRIDFDTAVSKGVNATIAYDVKNNKFFIAPNNSKNNIYVNESLLLMPVELKDYDIVEIGETKLLFRSLCNDRFTWEGHAEGVALKKN